MFSYIYIYTHIIIQLTHVTWVYLKLGYTPKLRLLFLVKVSHLRPGRTVSFGARRMKLRTDCGATGRTTSCLRKGVRSDVLTGVNHPVVYMYT